jgi:hypothetical protein
MNERSFIVNRHLRATMGSNRSAILTSQILLFATALRATPKPSEGGWAVSSILSDRPAAFAWLWRAKQPVVTKAAEIFLRFRIDHCFHDVMRHNRHRLRC